MKIVYTEEQNRITIMEPIEKLEIIFIDDGSVTKSLCGAWKDKRTDEEIVNDIYDSRLKS